jgi:hypothetical protein
MATTLVNPSTSIKSKYQLVQAFLHGHTVTIKGVTGRITAMELESGFQPPDTASHFNVTVGRTTVYLRLED